METKKNSGQNDPVSSRQLQKKVKVERTATANWQGDLKSGDGTLSTQSEMLSEVNYSFKTRFDEGERGTNPEELLAAAHAACFTMSVAAILAKKDLIAKSLVTEATVTLTGLSITSVHLSVTGSVEGITSGEFAMITKDAERNCLVSKIFTIPVSSEAHLVN